MSPPTVRGRRGSGVVNPLAGAAPASEGEALLEPVRRRYELHAPGVLYIVITVFLAIGAINSQNNLLFLSFGLAIAGFLISGLISGPPMMHVVARRTAAPDATVGEPAEIRYAIENRGGRLAAMGLEVRETSPSGGVGLFASGRSPVGLAKPGAVLSVRPGEREHAVLRATPTTRGVHRLNGFIISTTFPFGLFRKSLVFEQVDAWTVAPRRVALRPLPWHRSGREGATLSAVTNRRGRSGEFYALRKYLPGDPMRTIAWKQSARTGELVVREEAASAPPRIWIEMDRPSPGTPAHLIERAAALVSALANDATQAGFAVGLAGDGIPRLRPVAGARQVRAIRGCMASLAADDGSAEPGVPPPREPGALRVRVTYEGGASRAGEFQLSAADLERWFGGTSVPPEFEPVGGGGRRRIGALAASVRLARVPARFASGVAGGGG